MSIKLPTKFKKAFKKIAQSKYAYLYVVLFVIISGGAVAFYRTNSASGDASSPEKTVTDLAGNIKSKFQVGDEGYLKIKAFADRKSSSSDGVDIMMVIDNSASMKIDGAGGTKRIDQAVNAANKFIDDIAISSNIKLGVTSFGNNATLRSQLVNIDSQTNKDALKASIGNILSSSEGDTNFAAAAKISNDELLSARSRGGATKYILFLSDGLENRKYDGKYINGSEFKKEDALNSSTPIDEGSELDRSIDNKIKYLSIFFGDDTDSCKWPSTYLDTSNAGCSLLRFMAAKSNEISLANGDLWTDNYPTIVNLDKKFFFKSYDDLSEIYLSLAEYIQETGKMPIKITEKLAKEVNFVSLVSAKDKGGRSYLPLVSDSSSGEKIFMFPNGIDTSYTCLPDEPSCISGAEETTVDGNTVWRIEDNFIELILKIKFSSAGIFDIDSNATGCETGKTKDEKTKLSKVEYYNESKSEVLKTLYLPSKCIEVVYDGGSMLNVSKFTFSNDPLKAGNPEMKANFEGGDIVYVRLVVEENTEQRDEFIVTDELPNSAGKEINFTFSRAKDNFLISGNAIIANEGGRKFIKFSSKSGEGINKIDSLLNGKNYIDYSYEIL